MSELTEKPSPSRTPDRDWDPSAALARVANGNVVGFTARLHAAAEAYARFPPDHLTFEEIQQVISGKSQPVAATNAHLEACEFCSGLCEALATPDAAKQA